MRAPDAIYLWPWTVPTRWIYVRRHASQNQANFLRRLHTAALTDNGSQFTNRFTIQDKKSSV